MALPAPSSGLHVSMHKYTQHAHLGPCLSRKGLYEHFGQNLYFRISTPTAASDLKAGVRWAAVSVHYITELQKMNNLPEDSRVMKASTLKIHIQGLETWLRD